MSALIVIPAFNEEDALNGTVATLQSLPAGFEVLIVNDGSRDKTGPLAEQLARTSRVPLHVVHLPVNSGIGAAVQTGYRYALERGSFKYVIQFDGDGQHDANYLVPLVEKCDREALDLCIGSRFLTETPEGFQSTYSRRIGIRFTDPTSGYRCAGPRAWQRFAEHYPEDYPEPEALFWCARNRLRVAELPVIMHERQGGVSSIRQLKAVYYMIKVSMAILFDRMRRVEVPA
jgi:glycosyltransferase involved in cell wall biosynthesis